MNDKRRCVCLVLVVGMSLLAAASPSNASFRRWARVGPTIGGTGGEAKLFSEQITCKKTKVTVANLRRVMNLSKVEATIVYEECNFGKLTMANFSLIEGFNITTARRPPKETLSFPGGSFAVGEHCTVRVYGERNLPGEGLNLTQRNASYKNEGVSEVAGTLNLVTEESPNENGLLYTSSGECGTLAEKEAMRTTYTATERFTGATVMTMNKEEEEKASGEWLVEGAPVLSSLPIAAEGTITLVDLNIPLFGETSVECKGTFDGTVGAEGTGEFTELLNSKGENKALVCKGVKGACGTGVEAAEVKAVGLPWETELLLSPAEEFEVGTEKKKYAERVQLAVFREGEGPEFEIKCKSSGLSDSCATEVFGAVVTQEGSNPLATLNLQEEELLGEGGSCSQGGEGKGLSEGSALIKLTGSETGLALEGI